MISPMKWMNLKIVESLTKNNQREMMTFHEWGHYSKGYMHNFKCIQLYSLFWYEKWNFHGIIGGKCNGLSRGVRLKKGICINLI